MTKSEVGVLIVSSLVVDADDKVWIIYDSWVAHKMLKSDNVLHELLCREEKLVPLELWSVIYVYMSTTV